MTPLASNRGIDVVGREAELSLLNSFLDDVINGPNALVLEGESGIGKTTLWGRGITAATGRNWRVLSSRPAESEAKLSFAVLADLLVASDDLVEALPSPQRHALKVAILKAEPDERSSEGRAVSAAALTAFREAGARGPALIAIDDVQWVDASTASALEFAMRRLENEPLGLLLATRESVSELPFRLSRAFPEERVTRVALEPFSIDNLGALLNARLGANLPRPTLKRLCEMSGGNPFFALEIARAELRGERRPTGAALPIPKSLRDDVLRDRLVALPSGTRETLLYASACSRPTPGLLEAATATNVDKQLSRAADARIVETAGQEVVFTHPLYRSAIYAQASRDHRHRVHRRLAEVMEDPEERARHLALAGDGPDPEAAAALEKAAHLAHARGSPAAAAELCKLAEQLSPPERASDARRLRMAEAEYLAIAGDFQHAAEVVKPVVADALPGPERADTLFHLGRLLFVLDDYRGASEALADALLEDGVAPELLSLIHGYLAWGVFWLGDLREGERHAEEAVRFADLSDDPGALAGALTDLIGMRGWLGKKIPPDIIERAMVFEGVIQPLFVGDRLSIVRAGQMASAGHLDEARETYARLLDEATTLGDEVSIGDVHFMWGWVEYLSGNWGVSREHIAESMARGSHADNNLALVALIEACIGNTQAALTNAKAVLDHRTDRPLHEILARSALGFVQLSEGNTVEAHEHLERAWQLHRKWGIGEPTKFPFVADHVEALIELGQYTEAREVQEWLEERGRALDRPWALAVSARYRGLLMAATGDMAGALSSLDGALRHHEDLPMAFELGRTLFVLGTIRRRTKQKRPAREALEQALEIFERLGSPLWATKARAELARVSGRRPMTAGLTPVERRVARLAAAGRTNKEIADTLFMSPRTVGGHLSHVYAKLGIRSRTDLGHVPDLVEDTPLHS